MEADEKRCIICKNPSVSNDTLKHPTGGIGSIREYGKLFSRDDILESIRNDTLGDTLLIFIHRSCQKKIGNDIRKKKRTIEKMPCETSSIKRRSLEPLFDWKLHCLFCSKPAVEDENFKHPEREMSHVSKPLTPDVKNTLLEMCKKQTTEIADTVRGRLMFVTDIVAAKIRYHRVCYRKFTRDDSQTNETNISTPNDEAPAKRPGRPKDEKQSVAFTKLCEWFEMEGDLLP